MRLRIPLLLVAAFVIGLLWWDRACWLSATRSVSTIR